MSEPFVGEIRMFAGNFAPRGWAFCDGQLLAVSQNDALFSLFGTIYGGDGRTSFGLPDLRGRVPMHQGTGPGLSPRRLGSRGGLENVTITVNQLPSHNHNISASTAEANATSPAGTILAQSVEPLRYVKADSDAAAATLNAQSIRGSGGSRSHTNLQPGLCINFIVALIGIYPSRH